MFMNEVGGESVKLSASSTLLIVDQVGNNFGGLRAVDEVCFDMAEGKGLVQVERWENV